MTATWRPTSREMMQALLPFVAFAGATLIPRLAFAHRRALA